MSYDTWKTTDPVDAFEVQACEACDDAAATIGRYCTPCWDRETTVPRILRNDFDVAAAMENLRAEIARVSGAALVRCIHCGDVRPQDSDGPSCCEAAYEDPETAWACYEANPEIGGQVK